MIRDTVQYRIHFDTQDFALPRHNYTITKEVIEWYSKFCSKDKVSSIKAVRLSTGLPLREAKDLVDMIDALSKMVAGAEVVDPYEKLGRLVRYDNELS